MVPTELGRLFDSSTKSTIVYVLFVVLTRFICSIDLSLCISFLTLINNINIIHMGVTLAELRLLGKNTRHSQVGYIGHRCGRLF